MSIYNKLANAIDCTIDQKRFERQVTLDDVVDATRECPICGSKAKRKVVCKLQDDPLVEYLHCPDCKGNSTSLLPSDEYLASYYSTYYVGHDKEVTFPGEIARFANHIYKFLKIDKNKNFITIMDFGGGDGSVAFELGKLILEKHKNIKKIHVTLVDYNIRDEFENDTFKFTSIRTLEEVNTTFDVVIASAIIEHIPYLDPVLKKLFEVSAGGYLYIRVPYLMPFKKIFKNLPMLYPMHMHDLGPAFWNRIIDRYKLNAQVVASRPPLSETEYKNSFWHTLLGDLFKVPAFAEIALRNHPKNPIWNYVAGWEYMIKINR